jgi:hypothetical protein
MIASARRPERETVNFAWSRRNRFWGLQAWLG